MLALEWLLTLATAAVDHKQQQQPNGAGAVSRCMWRLGPAAPLADPGT